MIFALLLTILTVATVLSALMWVTCIDSKPRMIAFGVSALLLAALLFSRI